jgi:hypothetical protein
MVVRRYLKGWEVSGGSRMVRRYQKGWEVLTINVPLFKKLRDIIFFCGTITL